MKKFFGYALLFALFMPLQVVASSWAISKEVVDNRIHFPYVVDRVLADRPVYYAVGPDITPEEEAAFVDGVRHWPRETAQAIEQADRTEEFADILPLLKREIRFVKTDENNADIVVIVEETNPSVEGYFWPGNNRIAIDVDHRETFAEIILHEAGHYWGLADQYAGERFTAHPTYSSDVNTQEGSMMRGSYTTGGNLTCDDYDGLINLFDLKLAQQRGGRFSERAQKGWYGLCRSVKNFYQESKTTNRKRIDKDEKNYRACYHFYDEQGRYLRKEFCLSSFPSDMLYIKDSEKVIWDNGANRVISAYNKRKDLLRVFRYRKNLSQAESAYYVITVDYIFEHAHLDTFEITLTEAGALNKGNKPLENLSSFVYKSDRGDFVAFRRTPEQSYKFGITNAQTGEIIKGKTDHPLLTFETKSGEEQTIDWADVSREKKKVYETAEKYLENMNAYFYEPLFQRKRIVENMRKQIAETAYSGGGSR